MCSPVSLFFGHLMSCKLVCSGHCYHTLGWLNLQNKLVNTNNSFYPNSGQCLKAFIVKLISKLITLSVNKICIEYSVKRIQNSYGESWDLSCEKT